jgi:hypothetical protein
MAQGRLKSIRALGPPWTPYGRQAFQSSILFPARHVCLTWQRKGAASAYLCGVRLAAPVACATPTGTTKRAVGRRAIGRPPGLPPADER